MASTRTKNPDQSLLAHNTARYLHKQDTTEATSWLCHHKILFQIIRSDEGYWVNVSWPNDITGPLSYQELDQLPKFQTLRGDQNVQNSNKIQ